MRTKLPRVTPVLIVISSLCLAHAACADVPLDIAVEAAQAAVAACRSKGYQITVTILNADYSTRLVLRDADVAEPTVGIGRRKAYTVIKTGMTSGDFGKTVPGQPPPPAPGAGPPPEPGPINGDPMLIPWAGGLPILAHGQLIGAMSVSGAPGGEKDEACVRAGLAMIAARLK
jgi:uncharacterized protein GlcG (DUF336 family)